MKENIQLVKLFITVHLYVSAFRTVYLVCFYLQLLHLSKRLTLGICKKNLLAEMYIFLEIFVLYNLFFIYFHFFFPEDCISDLS